ncbi:MAG: tetratricopeptide repeat protein [Parvularculaceae bacterium]|nr:tetratricopeptide repeat protein [Parvularculaceae bacterium]
MRWVLGLSASMVAVSASAQMAITTFGATDAQACYEDARNDRETSTDKCDAALVGQALTKRDRLATYVNRGIINNRAGKLTDALADFNTALDGDAGLGEAWLNRGNTRFLGGQYDLAVNDYEKSLDNNLSKPWVAWYNIGLAREAQKDARAARTAYERALEINPDFGPAKDKLGLSATPSE